MKVHKWMEEVRIVAGYNRAVLYDLNRQDFQFVPKELHSLINKIEGNSLPELNENELEWYRKLIEDECFFEVSTKMYSLFKPLNLEWEHSSFIINAIIEDSEYLARSIDLLDNLICKYLLIITDRFDRIEEILSQHFTVSNFQKIDFVIDELCETEKIEQLQNQFPLLGQVRQKKEFENRTPRIVSINSRYFLEAQKFNTYFNRKLYIDANGSLKNAPECSEIFESINNINNVQQLKQIISSKSFQKYWTVNRDNISNCQQCELRYMCFDKRLPKQRKNGEWFFDTECEYNPYISKWKNEDEYRTLDECGIVDNENEFAINHQQVEKMNLEIWGE